MNENKMTSKTYEQIRDELANTKDYEGDRFAFKAGFDAATEYWKSLAGVEFESKPIRLGPMGDDERDNICREQGRKEQFDKLLPVIGALKGDLANQTVVIQKYKDANQFLHNEIAALKAENATQLKISIQNSNLAKELEAQLAEIREDATCMHGRNPHDCDIANCITIGESKSGEITRLREQNEKYRAALESADYHFYLIWIRNESNDEFDEYVKHVDKLCFEGKESIKQALEGGGG